jgi:fatty acid/phospholipid biosynthesis enzyme
MKIGIDILGGDFAPEANVSGAVLARKELPEDVKLVLIGDRELISSGLLALGETESDYEIVHAPDVITMHGFCKYGKYWRNARWRHLQNQYDSWNYSSLYHFKHSVH